MKHLMNKGEERVSYSAGFEWCQRLQKEARGTVWGEAGSPRAKQVCATTWLLTLLTKLFTPQAC